MLEFGKTPNNLGEYTYIKYGLNMANFTVNSSLKRTGFSQLLLRQIVYYTAGK